MWLLEAFCQSASSSNACTWMTGRLSSQQQLTWHRPRCSCWQHSAFRACCCCLWCCNAADHSMGCGALIGPGLQDAQLSQRALVASWQFPTWSLLPRTDLSPGDTLAGCLEPACPWLLTGVATASRSSAWMPAEILLKAPTARASETAAGEAGEASHWGGSPDITPAAGRAAAPELSTMLLGASKAIHIAGRQPMCMPSGA